MTVTSSKPVQDKAFYAGITVFEDSLLHVTCQSFLTQSLCQEDSDIQEKVEYKVCLYRIKARATVKNRDRT